VVFTLGCFLGMGLPALLTVQFIAPGTQIGGQAVAVRQAEGIANAFGGLGNTPALILWYLVLLTGFWILYSTQLNIMDLFPRTVTDMLWTSNPTVRKWAKGDVRKVYYASLIIFVVWGCIAINLAQPFILILLGAFMAGLEMAIYGVHVWYVNHKFLPRELRAPAWRQAVLWLFSAFFGFFAIVVILNRLFGVTIGAWGRASPGWRRSGRRRGVDGGLVVGKRQVTTVEANGRQYTRARTRILTNGRRSTFYLRQERTLRR